MYTIKKYANGRFYDTVEKNYITRSQIAELAAVQKQIEIIDTKTGNDITSDILADLSATDKKEGSQKSAPKTKAKKREADSDNFFVQMLRKGGDTLSDVGKKYVSIWQNLMTMSKEEIDKAIHLLTKDHKLSEFEADKIKQEMLKYRDNIQSWITKNIDQRINDVLSRMNLPTRDQVLDLTTKINDLNSKIEKLEKKTSALGKKSETS